MIDALKRLFAGSGEARQEEQKRQSRERLSRETTVKLRQAMNHHDRVSKILNELLDGSRGVPLERPGLATKRQRRTQL